MKKIYPNFSEPNFINQVVFELNSWIGRHIFKSVSQFKPNNEPYLIDIGVGQNYTDGWTHVDFYRSRVRRFWKKKPQRLSEIETDLRYPLNCSDSVVDGIYSGHTLEHLYPRQAYNLLHEMYRILKPGCWLRINVPDLENAVKFYNGDIDLPKYQFKAEAICNLTQNHGHHSVWDFELLSYALGLTGFINIKRVEFGKGGTDRRLIKEEEVRRNETLVVEAQKPK